MSLDLLRNLQDRVTAVERQLGDPPGVDNLQPNVLTQNPDGTIGANLTGHLKAAGVDLTELATLAAPGGVSVAGMPFGVGSAWAGATGTFYWVVTAYNANGETNGSAEVSLAMTTGNPGAHIRFNSVAGATGYRLYRAAAPAGETVSPAFVTSQLDPGPPAGQLLAFVDNGAATTTGAAPATNTAVQTNSLERWLDATGTEQEALYGTVAGGAHQLWARVGGPGGKAALLFDSTSVSSFLQLTTAGNHKINLGTATVAITGGSGQANIAHGLGAVPQIVIAGGWFVAGSDQGYVSTPPANYTSTQFLAAPQAHGTFTGNVTFAWIAVS